MSGLVERLRAVDDADVRLIAHLDAVDFAVEYVRDDVRPQYSDEELDEAYRTIMGAQVTGNDLREIIGERFEAQSLFFEDTVVLLFPSARYEAVFASFDRHDEFPVTELIDIAAEFD